MQRAPHALIRLHFNKCICLQGVLADTHALSRTHTHAVSETRARAALQCVVNRARVTDSAFFSVTEQGRAFSNAGRHVFGILTRQQQTHAQKKQPQNNRPALFKNANYTRKQTNRCWSGVNSGVT